MVNTLTDDGFSQIVTMLFRKSGLPRQCFRSLRRLRQLHAGNEAAVRFIDNHLGGREESNAGWVAWAKINMGGPMFPDDDVRVMRVEGPEPGQVAYAAVLPGDRERIVNTPFIKGGA